MLFNKNNLKTKVNTNGLLNIKQWVINDWSTYLYEDIKEWNKLLYTYIYKVSKENILEEISIKFYRDKVIKKLFSSIELILKEKWENLWMTEIIIEGLPFKFCFEVDDYRDREIFLTAYYQTNWWLTKEKDLEHIDSFTTTWEFENFLEKNWATMNINEVILKWNLVETFNYFNEWLIKDVNGPLKWKIKGEDVIAYYKEIYEKEWKFFDINNKEFINNLLQRIDELRNIPEDHIIYTLISWESSKDSDILYIWSNHTINRIAQYHGKDLWFKKETEFYY
jgi:hypothetical protein